MPRAKFESMLRGMQLPQTGGCQCGRVRYQVTAEPARTAMCHCTECQRQSGSAFGMSMFVLEEHFALTQGELKSWTRKAESGREVSCHFCPECGTRIYHQAKAYPGLINIKPGTLDDTSWLAPNISVWMRSKQPWVQVPAEFFTHDKQP